MLENVSDNDESLKVYNKAKIELNLQPYCQRYTNTQEVWLAKAWGKIIFIFNLEKQCDTLNKIQKLISKNVEITEKNLTF